MDKETEEEQEVDRSNLARIVTEPFGKPISGKEGFDSHSITKTIEVKEYKTYTFRRCPWQDPQN